MKIFIGQPGGFGDIIICAPIAKHYYDEGHEIYWPIGVEHLSLLQKFSYVTPLPLPNIALVNYPDSGESIFTSRMLMGKNLADAMGAQYLNLGDRPVTPRLDGETVEEKKYRVGEVDFEKKYRLEWTRDEDKENKLYEHVVSSHEYVFTHMHQSDKSYGSLPAEEIRDVVECCPIPGYDILDWYKVITNAQAVYCIESSLQCLVDALGKTIENKYILSTKDGISTTTSRDWNRKYL